MKLNKSKIFSALILSFVLFSFLGSLILAAERGLEVEYPKLDEEEIIATTTLPEYVKYIFKFSLIIAAIAAFAVLIYGGFRYLTSAGAPEAMRDAKGWIFGGILGLVLLLCSYLILTTINPELISPKEPEIKPFVGIYLINDKDEKLYFIQDTPKITQEFEDLPFGAISVMFLSNGPANQNFADPEKAELRSVFFYEKENYKGDVKKIDNTKKLDDDPVTKSLEGFSPKSLRFLWHWSGIYLYDQPTGWQTDSWPLFLRSSSEDLKGFSDEANKSLKIVNSSINESYWVVLFDHVHFRGKCDFAWQDTGSFSDRVRDKVSSIAFFKVTPQYFHGEVIFYDQKNCLGNPGPSPGAWTPPPPNHILPYDLIFSTVYFINTDPPKSLEDHVESFRINGNFSVLLNTKADRSGDCQLFTKLGCTETLKGSSVYCWPWWRCRPKIALILPIAE